MKQSVKTVGEEFVFQLNARGVRVLKGVHGDVKVVGDLRNGSGNRQQPLQNTLLLGVSCRVESLRFSVPVPGQVVVSRVKDFVEHVVHGLHQIVASAMV